MAFCGLFVGRLLFSSLFILIRFVSHSLHRFIISSHLSFLLSPLPLPLPLLPSLASSTPSSTPSLPPPAPLTHISLCPSVLFTFFFISSLFSNLRTTFLSFPLASAAASVVFGKSREALVGESGTGVVGIGFGGWMGDGG